MTNRLVTSQLAEDLADMMKSDDGFLPSPSYDQMIPMAEELVARGWRKDEEHGEGQAREESTD